ncbi:MAG: hypothetical protein OEZ43_21910 [Gammaproteobacteria bacterium]|nr:hypothetical protein [Gammaproteobacteria bacterium]
MNVKTIQLAFAYVLLIVSLSLGLRAFAEIFEVDAETSTVLITMIAPIVSLVLLNLRGMEVARLVSLIRIIAVSALFNLAAIIHVPVAAVSFSVLGFVAGLAASFLVQKVKNNSP